MTALVPRPTTVEPGDPAGAGVPAPARAAARSASAGSSLGPRRLRRTPGLRALVRETRLHPSMFVAPLFVRPGRGLREPIPSLSGHARLSPDEAASEARRLHALGIGGVILFGLPEAKDPLGLDASAPDGIVQEAIRRIRDAVPDLVTIADTCLCEYTDHGHCGPLAADGSVDNDAAIERLAAAALAQADAGVDIVAPSAMMDGQVAAIRAALDESGHGATAILAYAAKTASAFYGPFRDAADCAPQFGDRRGYQMDPANGREAMRELDLDEAEGADILMIKPALPNLDLIAAARARSDLPIAAYQVSGEYAMVDAAAERGWLDRRLAITESVTSIVRAGASIVVTYAAADMAGWLREA
jgi:porphobilinogen synthase